MSDGGRSVTVYVRARRDLAAGLVAALLSVVFLSQAFAIHDNSSSYSVIGPRVAPLVIGGLGLALSVILIVQSLLWRRMREAAQEDHHELPEGFAELVNVGSEMSLPRVLTILGIFTGYVLLFIPLGYVVATFLFLTTLTTFVDPSAWRRNILIAAAFASIVYLAFTQLLEVNLPSGILG